MVHTLPRLRNLRRTRAQRLWWLAVGLAVVANLGVIVGLAQVSGLQHPAPAPSLALRSLRRLEAPPPVLAEPPPAPRLAQAGAAPVPALPSLDLPPAGPMNESSLPACSGVGSLDALPLLGMPAFTAIAPPGLAAGTQEIDTPAERIGAFDLDRFYPRSARLRGLTGSSRVRSLIGADGRVGSVTVLESTPPGVFDQAAERLARGLRYSPAIRGGQAVASVQDTVIAWTLK